VLAREGLGAGVDRLDDGGADVRAEDPLALRGELDGQRQADLAQADDGDVHGVPSGVEDGADSASRAAASASRVREVTVASARWPYSAISSGRAWAAHAFLGFFSPTRSQTTRTGRSRRAAERTATDIITAPSAW